MAKGSSSMSPTMSTGLSRGRTRLPDTITRKPDFSPLPLTSSRRFCLGGTQLHVQHVLISDDWAVAELQSEATAKNGLRFDNRCCWVCRFANGMIVEVRAYLDSALVARLFEENPI